MKDLVSKRIKNTENEQNKQVTNKKLKKHKTQENSFLRVQQTKENTNVKNRINYYNSDKKCVQKKSHS